MESQDPLRSQVDKLREKKLTPQEESSTPDARTVKGARNLRLVVFDVEGIVIPKQSYILRVIGLLNIPQKLKVLFDGLLYEVGIRPLKSTLERIYTRFRGVSLNDFTESFTGVSFIPEVKEVVRQLKERHVTTALISSGIPSFLLEELAQKLNVDYVIGPELKVIDDKLTGTISGDVIEKDGKAMALTSLLETTGIQIEDCAVVADDRNNLPMFKPEVTKIGFHPDFILTTHCDYVVRGNLTGILLILLGSGNILNQNTGQRYNFTREGIHIGSFTIPLMCQFLGVDRFLIGCLLLIISPIYAISEIVRLKGKSLPPFTTLTQRAVVAGEQWSYATSPIFFALGIVLAFVLFQPTAGYVAVTVLTLGDGLAKVVGRKWGRTNIPFNRPKKLEGTLAGLIISALVATIYTTPSSAILAALAGMLVETLPTPVNDNLLIAVIAGLAATITF